MKMKHFAIITTILAAVVASGQADARLVSTKAQCVAVCGNAVSDSCGWITKRGKFNRCRAKLYNRCKRWGTATMCPAPPPPPTTTTTLPPPPTTTTTTTLPPPPTTTTTTVPVVHPTTTTTLPPPPVNPAAPYAGTWSFFGSLAQNTCPDSLAVNVHDTLIVTLLPASPGAARGTIVGLEQISFDGGVLDNGDLGLGALAYNGNGCTLDIAILLDGPITSATRVTAGGYGFDADCPAYPTVCRVIYTGSWTRQ